MIDSIKSGDLIAISGKGPLSWMIQAGTLSMPNFGPLGRLGLAGPSHVGIVVSVNGEMLVYESTSMPRPPCVRTRREKPLGVQAHHLSDVIDGTDAWHYPLKTHLYEDEELRLLRAADSCLGRGYDYFSAGRAGGGRLIRLIQILTQREDLKTFYCSEFVMALWVAIGVCQARNASNWSPSRLVRHARRTGIVGPVRLLT